MVSIGFTNGELTVDGKNITDFLQEENNSQPCDLSVSYEDTNTISKALSTIARTQGLEDRIIEAISYIECLDQNFPELSYEWGELLHDAKHIQSEILEDKEVLNSLISRVFDTRGDNTFEVSELASQYIMQHKLVQDVVKTNLSSGILHVSSVDQINREALSELTEKTNRYDTFINCVIMGQAEDILIENNLYPEDDEDEHSDDYSYDPYSGDEDSEDEYDMYDYYNNGHSDDESPEYDPNHYEIDYEDQEDEDGEGIVITEFFL